MSDMNVRLAIAPIGWTNDDLPELGPGVADRGLQEHQGDAEGGQAPLV